MKNLKFLEKALNLLKPPFKGKAKPVRTVEIGKKDDHVVVTPTAEFSSRELSKGDHVILDFGDHYVGYLSLDLNYTGSHPDAPVLLKLRFAENAAELLENRDEYHGWISSSWIQEEQVYADIIPSTLSLSRRYAFRYVAVEIVDISSKFKLKIDAANMVTVSGADDNSLLPFKGSDEFKSIDAVACRTLHNCMQTVFEDGPKRDRRLWLGDLRLQALANYYTYQNNDMVKACLYLFAALPLDDGMMGGCVFLEPEPEVDDTVMLDYSLLYVNALLDYYNATNDLDTLSELSETAYRQIELAKKHLGEDMIIKDSDQLGWCFLDWNLTLNKQAGAQGVFLYALTAARRIAEILNDPVRRDSFQGLHLVCSEAARRELWDEEQGFFVSGADRQVSWASQIWLTLGGAADREQAKDMLARLSKSNAVEPVTPYMYHHYIEALIMYGWYDEALDVIREYWGGMVKHGADTFWELYNPENPYESPYGGTIVNSYCHAWSCAPAYFLRRYF